MLRPLVAYALTAFILLSQVGLPLHFHYCKGMLESVSIFFNQGCNDHIELANLPACCKKTAIGHCAKKDDNCCDDEFKVLTQDITSLKPHVVTLVDQAVVILSVSTFASERISDRFLLLPGEVVDSDSGPPIYILHQSLIFYA